MYHKRWQLQFDLSANEIRMAGLIRYPHILGYKFIMIPIVGCDEEGWPPVWIIASVENIKSLSKSDSVRLSTVEHHYWNSNCKRKIFLFYLLYYRSNCHQSFVWSNWDKKNSIFNNRWLHSLSNISELSPSNFDIAWPIQIQLQLGLRLSACVFV